MYKVFIEWIKTVIVVSSAYELMWPADVIDKGLCEKERKRTNTDKCDSPGESIKVVCSVSS